MWWTPPPPLALTVRAVRVLWLVETLRTKRTLRSSFAMPQLRMRPNGSDKFETLARLHAQDGATEQHPRIELVRREPECDVVDRFQAGAGLAIRLVAGKIEIDFEESVRTEFGGHEVDHARVGCADGGNARLVGADPAVEAHALQRGRPVHRSYRVLRAQADRADRRAAFEEMRPRNGIGIRVQDQVDVALPV